MKKILVTISSLIVSTSVMAQMYTYVGPNNSQQYQRHHHEHRPHQNNNSDWIAPALIGGALLYGIGHQAGANSREPGQQVQIQPVPAYGIPAPVVRPQPAPIYGYRWVWDEQLNAWKWQLVQL